MTYIDMVHVGTNTDLTIGSGMAMYIGLGERDQVKVDFRFWPLAKPGCSIRRRCLRHRADYVQTLREAFKYFWV